MKLFWTSSASEKGSSFTGLVLASLPFIALLAAYWYASANGLAHLPTLQEMWDKVNDLAFTPDFRTGKYRMYDDTLVSLQRLGIGLGIASAAGFLIGINMGLSERMEKLFSSFLAFLGSIPSLSLLSLLLVWFGTGETVKVGIIFIATFFTICGNIFIATKKIPLQTKVKALTLGASKLDVTYRVVLPLIIPVFINQVRLSIGPAISALVVSEGIVAQAGLGFRIFMEARLFHMEGVIPYVLLITFIGWLAGWLLERLLAWKFSWYLRINK